MAVLAKIQTQKIDLLALIQGSPHLNQEQKEYWISKAKKMTPERQRALLQVFLTAQDQMAKLEEDRTQRINQAVQKFVKNVQAEYQTAKKDLWHMAEKKVRAKDDEAAENMLNQA